MALSFKKQKSNALDRLAKGRARTTASASITLWTEGASAKATEEVSMKAAAAVGREIPKRTGSSPKSVRLDVIPLVSSEDGPVHGTI